MRNISLNKEALTIEINRKYVIIDGLYINEINQRLLNLNYKLSIQEIRQIVFPYSDTPFAVYIPSKPFFKIEQIKKSNSIFKEKERLFSTDTGLLIVVAETLFINLIQLFDYYELVNTLIEPINLTFWDSISKNYQ